MVRFISNSVCFVFQVSAITAVYVIVLCVLLPLTGCSILLSHILQFWTAVVILAKMIYQLRLVDNSNWLSNCTVSPICSWYKILLILQRTCRKEFFMIIVGYFFLFLHKILMCTHNI